MASESAAVRCSAIAGLALALALASGPATADDDVARGAAPASAVLATTVVLDDDFEQGFPNANWDVFDPMGIVGGDLTWGASTARADGDTTSAWCAGGGPDAQPDGTSYVDLMSSWMVHGPFDLTDAAGAVARLRYWLDTEPDEDLLRLLASNDGFFFGGVEVSGTSGGWQDLSLDLADVPGEGDLTGSPEVWVAIVFTSGAGVVGEGAYVDRVRIERLGPSELFADDFESAGLSNWSAVIDGF
ncbi:MAG: hypothetical protein AAF772_12215 [Acidobacteriota bacterium]